MGGKSRKTGGVSLKLIQQLKSGSLNKSTSNKASNETKSPTTTLFTSRTGKQNKS